MSNVNVRTLALNVLERIEKDHSYSNLLLQQTIKKHELHPKDVALLTEIVYGTIQRKKTLDYYLAPFLPKKIKPRDQWMLSLLRMSLYQMVYLDRIPDRAIVFEAVQIAKKRGHRGLASIVNGILRNVQRKGLRSVKKISDEWERLAVHYSHPKWLLKRWSEQYGIEAAKAICEANLRSPLVKARVNTSKRSVEEVIDLLKWDHILARPGKMADEAIEIVKGNLIHSHVYEQGFVTIQDESSMLVADAVNVQKNERLLDCCAAPGGKTTHIAERLDDSGEIIALDLHEHKKKLIESQVERLQLNNVTTYVLDAREASNYFRSESFDRILVDAPCSGFGIIRRKPDIKWRKQESDIEQLAATQIAILNGVAPLLKKGGTLVYSTCTIEKEENEQVTKMFLRRNRDFSIDNTLRDRLPQKLGAFMSEDGQVQILPHYFESDGFFIAAFTKTADGSSADK